MAAAWRRGRGDESGGRQGWASLLENMKLKSLAIAMLAFLRFDHCFSCSFFLSFSFFCVTSWFSCTSLGFSDRTFHLSLSTLSGTPTYILHLHIHNHNTAQHNTTGLSDSHLHLHYFSCATSINSTMLCSAMPPPPTPSISNQLPLSAFPRMCFYLLSFSRTF